MLVLFLSLVLIFGISGAIEVFVRGIILLAVSLLIVAGLVLTLGAVARVGNYIMGWDQNEPRIEQELPRTERRGSVTQPKATEPSNEITSGRLNNSIREHRY